MHGKHVDNSSITFYSFGPSYGEDGWVVNPGDKLVVQVWNANTLTGPSMYLLTATGTPTEQRDGQAKAVAATGRRGGGTYPGTAHVRPWPSALAIAPRPWPMPGGRVQ